MRDNFARSENELDNDVNRYIAYNQGIAKEYLKAMKETDWQYLKNMNEFTLSKITYWLNTDNASSFQKERRKKEIPTGEFMTIKGTTFITEIIRNNNFNTAKVFVESGCKNPSLLAYFILNCSSEDYELVNNILITNYADPQSLEAVINSILNKIELLISIQTAEERNTSVSKVKEYLKSLKYLMGISKIDLYRKYNIK